MRTDLHNLIGEDDLEGTMKRFRYVSFGCASRKEGKPINVN